MEIWKMALNKLRRFTDKKLAEVGFVKNEDRRYDYYCSLDKAGEIGLTFKFNCFKRKNGITFFMMFSDQQKAIKAGFDCNPHSGKYNFYSCNTVDEIDYVLGHLIDHYWEN